MEKNGGAIEKYVSQESLEVIKSISSELASISSVDIRTDEEASAADAVVRRLLDHERFLKEDLKKTEAPFADPLKIIKDGYKSLLESIDNAKRKIKQARWSYDDKKAAERREAQARIDKESARIKAEQERKAEEIRKKAEAAAAAGDEAKAEKLTLKAEEMQTVADTMVAPIVASTAPAFTRATARRETWKGEITDEEQFKGWCITNCRWEYLSINPTAWNQYSKIARVAQTVPGARIYKEFC